MHIQRHPLPSVTPGTQRELVSFHYGTPGSGKKAYLQASLHSDELPGMLVAHHLRERLERLEKDGLIDGEIVVVPIANPIGISQAVHGAPFGRFDLATGINFNRGYRNLVPHLKEALAGRLGPDAQENMRLIRAEAHRGLAQWQPHSETEALKKTVMSLAIDADYMLDLHCDNQAVMHLYTGTPLADAIMPLARILGAQAVLLARESGDDPFDEACGRIWWELVDHFGDRFPVPFACVSATVELRGETDVTHEYATADADGLVEFLAHVGLILKTPGLLPQPRCAPTPLEGVEPIVAPHGGLLVFTRPVGVLVDRNEPLADLIDPVSGQTTVLRAGVPGRFFARIAHRFVQRGTSVAKIAGPVAFRTGKLLGQ